MHKAAQLAARLEQVSVEDGIPIIEACYADALHFDVIGDANCIMHADGSVSIIEIAAKVV